MTYYINVSLNGEHFFRTDEYSYFDIKNIFKSIENKFTKEEGYEVTVYKVIRYTKSSTNLEELVDEGFNNG